MDKFNGFNLKESSQRLNEIQLLTIYNSKHYLNLLGSNLELISCNKKAKCQGWRDSSVTAWS